MARRSLIAVPAVVAALAAGGCVPTIQNETAAQQDLIGPVVTSADVCDTPFVVIIGRSAAAKGRRALRRALPGLSRGPSDPPAPYGCPTEEQLRSLVSGGGEGVLAALPQQKLLAYRVPAGAAAPDTITARLEVLRLTGLDVLGGKTRGGGDGLVRESVTVTFRRSDEVAALTGPAFDADLAELGGVPKLVGDGQKVVGYLSDPLPGIGVGGYRIETPIALPGGDQPFTGPLNSLTLAGGRLALDDALWTELVQSTGGPEDEPNPWAPGRPVRCLDEEDVLRGGPDDELDLFGRAVCPLPGIGPLRDLLTGEEAPDADAFRAAYRASIAGIDTPTRDLRIAGGEAFAEQGQTATVPFTLRTAGAPSDAALTLTASTPLAGATAAPSQAQTGFPATGDTPRPVTVQVPPGAAPGTYAVTLTATIGGASRTGAGRVVVLPRTRAASRGRDNVYMDSDGNIAFGWICPPACGGARVDVTAPKAGIAPTANTAQASKPRLLRIARGSFDATAGKRARVKVRLFPRARRAVRRGRVVKAIIVVRQGGRGTPYVRRVLIRRAAGR